MLQKIHAVHRTAYQLVTGGWDINTRGCLDCDTSPVPPSGEGRLGIGVCVQYALCCGGCVCSMHCVVVGVCVQYALCCGVQYALCGGGCVYYRIVENFRVFCSFRTICESFLRKIL